MAKKKKQKTTTKTTRSTKKPSGKATKCGITSIDRNGTKLTCNWNKDSGLTSQKVQVRYHIQNRKDTKKSLKWSSWSTLSTSTSISKKSFSVKDLLEKHFVESVQFRVTAKAKGKNENHSEKIFDFVNVPSQYIKLKVEESEPIGHAKISYEVKHASDSNKYALEKVQFYYRAVKNSSKKPSFGTSYVSAGTRSSLSGSFNIKDIKGSDGKPIALTKDNDFYEVYFIAVPISYSGMASDAKKALLKYSKGTGWTKINYSTTPKTDIDPDKTAAWIDPDTGSLRFRVRWDPGITKGHPVDKVLVQYSLSVPDFRAHDEDASKPVTPVSTNWQDAGEFASDINKARTWLFTPDETLGEDQGVFIRIKGTHGASETFSSTLFLDDVFGDLKNPTLTKVETDQTTHKATVTATNNSEVKGSFLRVFATYQTGEEETDGERKYIGKIESGTDSGTFQCEDWSNYKGILFDVQAVAGSKHSADADDGWYMVSDIVSQNGVIPHKAGSVTAYAVVGKTKGKKDTIYVEWVWDWDEAQYAEVSWSDDPYSWESTTAPSSYTLASLKPTHCYIPSLETGKTWYVRVRLFRTDGQNSIYGDYSQPVAVDLSANPSRPKLTLSESGITSTGSVVASWVYETNISDGTRQQSAQLYDVKDGNYIPLSFASTESAQHITIRGEDLVREGWVVGEKHDLAVMVTSESGRSAEYSETDDLTLIQPPAINIGTINIEDLSITNDDGTVDTETTLTKLPITGSVATTGEASDITIIIERAQSSIQPRPDGRRIEGYDGEVVFSGSLDPAGDGTFSINSTDLFRPLDDAALYRIRVVVSDDYGQSVEESKKFIVRWADRALPPLVQLAIDDNNAAAQLTLVKPDGARDTDVCDVYRLSLDAPQLILSNGVLGNTYYDPYPALGANGGYRIVYKTAEGNYITADHTYAWLDTTDYDEAEIVDEFAIMIDYPGHHIELPYNINLDNSWSKDFTETKYLGGAVQGDWNLSVSRSVSVNTDIAVEYQTPLIKQVRELANYAGVCHVRTPDGSCFCGDVQVSENRDDKLVNKIAKFSLKITRVDPVDEEMLTADEWKEYLDSIDTSSSTGGSATIGGLTPGTISGGTTLGEVVSQIKELQLRVNTNTVDISGLKSADEAASTAATNLENRIKKNEDDIAAIKEELEAMQTSITNLQASDTAQNSNITTLQTDLAALKKKVGDFGTGTSGGDSASLEAIRTEINDLKTRVSTLETNGVASADLTALTGRVDTLEKNTVKTSDMVNWTDDEINTAVSD